jgi:type IV secretory pathway VirB3-like protein
MLPPPSIDDDELPFYEDPLALVSSLQLSPLVAGLTRAERLNAQVRLILVVGAAFAIVEELSVARTLIALIVVLAVVHLSVEDILAREKEISAASVTKKQHQPAVSMSTPPPPQPLQCNVPRDASEALRCIVQQQQRGASFDPSVERPRSLMDLIAADQREYTQRDIQRRRGPTRFDLQNRLLGVGGLPIREPGTEYSPMRDLGNTHPNPGPYDFGTAVRSTNPDAYTFETDVIDRMYRPADEVDPGLVTNPIPDPTFMARLPQFDTSYEDEAVERWRMQFHSGMRFF